MVSGCQATARQAGKARGLLPSPRRAGARGAAECLLARPPKSVSRMCPPLLADTAAFLRFLMSAFHKLPGFPVPFDRRLGSPFPSPAERPEGERERERKYTVLSLRCCSIQLCDGCKKTKTKNHQKTNTTTKKNPNPKQTQTTTIPHSKRPFCLLSLLLNSESKKSGVTFTPRGGERSSPRTHGALRPRPHSERIPSAPSSFPTAEIPWEMPKRKQKHPPTPTGEEQAATRQAWWLPGGYRVATGPAAPLRHSPATSSTPRTGVSPCESREPLTPRFRRPPR